MVVRHIADHRAVHRGRQRKQARVDESESAESPNPERLQRGEQYSVDLVQHNNRVNFHNPVRFYVAPFLSCQFPPRQFSSLARDHSAGAYTVRSPLRRATCRTK